MQKNHQKHVFWHQYDITRLKREKNHHHKSVAIWFTGLSGSGKSTIANAVESVLFHNGVSTYLIDGDNIRSGLCSDLGFSISDRQENMRRIGEVIRLMLDAGILVLVAVIAPYKEHRKMLSTLLRKKNIIEVFVDTPLSVCEQRDPKSLYQKARSEHISDFTGLQSEYEKPENPDIYLNGTLNLDVNVNKVIRVLHEHHVISFI